jgi:hypothetical protein
MQSSRDYICRRYVEIEFDSRRQAERTYAKVLADAPIAGEDEDAVISGDLLDNFKA